MEEQQPQVEATPDPAPEMSSEAKEVADFFKRAEGESEEAYRRRIGEFIRAQTPADPGEPFLIMLVRTRKVDGENMKDQTDRMERLKAILMSEDDVIDVAISFGTPSSARDKDIFAQNARRRIHDFVRNGWPASPKEIDSAIQKNAK